MVITLIKVIECNKKECMSQPKRGDVKKVVVVLGGSHHNMDWGEGVSGAWPKFLGKKLLFVFDSIGARSFQSVAVETQNSHLICVFFLYLGMLSKIGCQADFLYKHNNFGGIIGKCSNLELINYFSVSGDSEQNKSPQQKVVVWPLLPLGGFGGPWLCDGSHPAKLTLFFTSLLRHSMSRERIRYRLKGCYVSKILAWWWVYVVMVHIV